MTLVMAPPPAHGDESFGNPLGITVDNQEETIVLTVKNTSPHKVFTLPSPDRLVVDMPTVTPRPVASVPDHYAGHLIRSIRIGQFDPHTSRFVFDLTAPVHVVAMDDKSEGKIVITIAASQAASPVAESPVAVMRAPAKPSAKSSAPSLGAKGEEKNKIAHKPLPEKPIIVIDPGHGGVDPGTSGADGAYEKDIVLAYGKALKAALIATNRYKAILTRDDDHFIMLRERVQIARQAQGNLFISLHADSASELSARGLSVYTVSEKSSDEESDALAARENKSDVLSGMDLSQERPDVANILISLAERETKNRSATLADLLVTSLDERVHLLPNSHRFAGFAVLKAPDIPSVLVEIGFLSHPGEEKLLKSKAHCDKVASGLVAGIDRYFALEKKMGDQ